MHLCWDMVLRKDCGRSAVLGSLMQAVVQSGLLATSIATDPKGNN